MIDICSNIKISNCCTYLPWAAYLIFYVLQAHKDGVSNDDYRRQQHAHNKNCLVAFEKELNKKGQIGMVNKGLVFIYLKGELSRQQGKKIYWQNNTPYYKENNTR